MRTTEIIKEIEKMPVQKQIYVIEQTIHFIKEKENKYEMKRAAELLLDNYKNDKELIAFSNLDFDDFYETR